MKFIVHFRYKADADWQEIVRLIPAEQNAVAQLNEQGLLEHVYISKDVQQGWLVFNSDDEHQVRAATESLPLYPFWTTDLVNINSPF